MEHIPFHIPKSTILEEPVTAILPFNVPVVSFLCDIQIHRIAKLHIFFSYELPNTTPNDTMK